MCAGGAGGIDLGPGRHRAFFISLLVRHVRDLPPQLEDGSCRARREGEGLQNIEDVIHGVLLPWLELRPDLHLILDSDYIRQRGIVDMGPES